MKTNPLERILAAEDPRAALKTLTRPEVELLAMAHVRTELDKANRKKASADRTTATDRAVAARARRLVANLDASIYTLEATA